MEEIVDIKLKKLHEDAVIPSYAHDGDVGMDLTAISMEYDAENDMYVYHTGISIETDKHYGILLFPRSSNRKTDAYLCNHVGVVDSAIYRGEIILCFKNRDSIEITALREMLSHLRTLSSMDNIIKECDNAHDNVINNPEAYAPYEVGNRIAQMVVIPYPTVNINVVDELSTTERNDNGFGSSGD